MTPARVLPRYEVLPFIENADDLLNVSSGWCVLRPERWFPVSLPTFVGADMSLIAGQNVFRRGTYRTPEICLSKYQDVTVLPHQFILLDDGVVSGDSLEETVCFQDQVWFEEKESFESQGRMLTFPRLASHQWHEYQNLIDISEADDRALIEIDETVFSILSWYPANVSHWLVDILPRLWSFARVRSDVSKLLVPKVAMPFAKESLALLGFRDEDIIWFSNENRYRIKCLYVPSRMASHYNYFTPEIIEFYEALHTQIPGFCPDEDAFLYVSRRDSSKRQCLSEPEFEKRLVDLGFRIVCLSDFSFEERISLFAGAKFVAGACGAGLAHSLLMPAQSTLFITGTPLMHRQSTLFLNIATQKQQQVSLFAGSASGHGSITEVDWEFDVEDATASLRRVMDLHGGSS